MTAVAQRVLNYLLVEDNHDHADLIERCFRFGNIPCEIRRVNSGAECLAYLAGDESYANRSEYPYPDVILMDIRMPGVVDGLHALQAIRSDPRHRHLSVMMLTSSDRNTDVSRAYALGANGYVVKSSDTDDMIETLRQLQQSFSSLQRLPDREPIPPPGSNQPVDLDPTSFDLAPLLDADQASALRMLVAAYRHDPHEMMRMLKVLEQTNTTRFAATVSRFCMEQRSLFAGGKEVDWPFIQRIVMDKLPQYEDAERMGGIVATISAELEGNEWASGDEPSCQAWRGFSTAYLRQRWHTPVSSTGPISSPEPAQSPGGSIWMAFALTIALAITSAVALISAIALYAVFTKHASAEYETPRTAFEFRDIASVAFPRQRLS